MSIIYPDTTERPNFFINPYNMDATKQWLKHYANYKLLQFIHDSTKDGKEKRQANQEIQKAQTKMSYWWKMPNLVQSDLEKGKKVIDQQWKGK